MDGQQTSEPASAKDEVIHSSKSKLVQSQPAIRLFVLILFLEYLYSIVTTFSAADTRSFTFISKPMLIFSLIIDVFLCTNLLVGKSWARTWLLIRIILGTCLFGGIFLFQADYGSMIYAVGLSFAEILLLTGRSNRFRIFGSVSLAIVAPLIGIFLPVISSSLNYLPEVPETLIPSDFKTYTSEGFFSISYPPDWEPAMAAVDSVEKIMKQGIQDVDSSISTKEMQVVFTGIKNVPGKDGPGVFVSVEPKPGWPLETVLESTTKIIKEHVRQYTEYSRFKTTIGGRQAIIISATGYDADGYFVGNTSAFVAGDKFLWTVQAMCVGEDLNVNLVTFNDIVRSLRVQY